MLHNFSNKKKDVIGKNTRKSKGGIYETLSLKYPGPGDYRIKSKMGEGHTMAVMRSSGSRYSGDVSRLII